MIYVITILVWLVLDQVTKLHITSHIHMHQTIPVIPGFLSITHVTNMGGAFGIMASFPAFFLILTGMLTVVGLALIWSISKLSLTYQIAFGSVIGGAAGNLVDRIRIGKVIDFIDFSFWPTFNVADIAICVGVGLLMIQLFRERAIEAANNGGDTQPESGSDESSKGEGSSPAELSGSAGEV